MYRGYLLPHLKFYLLVGRMLRSRFGAFPVQRFIVLENVQRFIWKNAVKSKDFIFLYIYFFKVYAKIIILIPPLVHIILNLSILKYSLSVLFCHLLREKLANLLKHI